MKKIILVVGSLLIALSLFAPSQASAGSKAEDLVDFAKRYEGTPYKFGGTTPNGFDCSGFNLFVFNQHGIQLPRTAASQYKIGQAVSRSNLQIGDMVFFSNTYKPGVSHAGIYVGNNSFISAVSKGVQVVSLSNSYWASRYTGARRMIEEPVVDQAEVIPEPPKEETHPNLPTGQFYDVGESHWAAEEILSLSNEGIITGFAHSFFKPKQGITRGQAAIMLNRDLNLTSGDSASFTDVGSSTAGSEHIAAIEQADIMEGFADGSFRPNEPVTRGQMALVLKRAYELEVSEVTIAEDVHINDVSVETKAHEAVMALYSNEITKGFDDGTFRPNETTTRAQFSALLHRTKTN